MATKTISVYYKPHPGQEEFHQNKTRFRILACGRRWGKTISGANEAIRQAWKTGENNVGFCVAPTYWHTQKQWTEFFLHCPGDIISEIRRGDRHVILEGNRNIWFKSADNPDSLRSEGLDWLWVDEGGQIKEEAWTLALRPALMDKKGIAWFTGTPKGHNWYFMLWTRGRDEKQLDYKSWNYGSLDNPFVDPKEIEDFARDMPKMAYEQEIMGRFIEDVGSVFRGVKACIKGKLEPYKTSKHYVMGVDLAKYEDFTVLCILDDNGHLCAFDRFGEIDWVFQKKRVVNLATQYNARVLIDATGVGDPFYDELRREQVRVEGFKFTNASKKDLIENLSINIENQTISYPNIPELINEMGLFGYTRGKTGLYHYNAPEGYHDDCVISLALACWQLSKPKGFFM